MKDTILLLEDDTVLRMGIAFDLEAEGYQIIATNTCAAAIEAIKNRIIHLAILDVNLPDGDGFTCCRKIKEIKDIPVIFLTARDMMNDEINGFEVGADDYITKPFSNIILRKRVQAVLKRFTSSIQDDKYVDDYLYIDFNNYICKKQNQPLSLTPTEFKLLKLLIINSGNVVTRQMILEKLWDNRGNFVDEHALTVNVNRVRSKLESQKHKYIKTIYGLGYTWIGEKFE